MSSRWIWVTVAVVAIAGSIALVVIGNNTDVPPEVVEEEDNSLVTSEPEVIPEEPLVPEEPVIEYQLSELIRLLDSPLESYPDNPPDNEACQEFVT